MRTKWHGADQERVYQPYRNQERHEHLKDSANLLNDMPSGKQMVNIGPNAKKSDNPSIANLL
jgi:hypothetical protein